VRLGPSVKHAGAGPFVPFRSQVECKVLCVKFNLGGQWDVKMRRVESGERRLTCQVHWYKYNSSLSYWVDFDIGNLGLPEAPVCW
jgi:hypothetical protein